LRADPNNRFAAKEIARRLRSLETKLDRLRADKGDPTMVTWSQLGITAIHVDEAVAYKRLPAPCHTAGFNPGSSARALDLKMKVDLLRADDPNRPHVAFYTGTPFTNTILETWVWQTYLQPDRLREAGIDQLDAWIGTFVTMATKVEPSPEGGTLRLITRPYEYRNVAELMAMFSEVAVLVDPATIPLPRPERVDHTVAVDRTAEQARFVGTLAARADAIRNGGSGDDNMLLVCGQGRAAALDPALVGLDGGSPKLDAVIGRVAAEYHAHRDDPIPGSAVPGGLQLLFCDWGVPKPGLVSTYTRLRDGLIAAGVPAGMIRFVHEATDDKSKAALFGACRDGKVAVLIASTEKAGMGTNVQTRLFAVHHVDAPWRPADMEQRDGRALRPGNTYATVQVYRYLTRGTFDAYTYAALARKAHIPAQLIKAATDPTIRDVDELGEVEIGYQQLAALASGNPLLLDRATAAAEVRRLRLMRSISLQNLTTARNVVTETQARTLQLRDTLSAIAIAAGQVEEASADRASLRVVTDECRSMVTSTRPGWGTSMTRSMMWRGLPLIGNVHRSPETDRPTSAAILVRIPRHASLTVGTWPRRWWRASPAQVTEAVNVAINEWVDQLPHLAATLEHDLDQTRRAHDAAAQIVTGWASPYDAPLAAAEARLAHIDAALTADAVTDPLVA